MEEQWEDDGVEVSVERVEGPQQQDQLEHFMRFRGRQREEGRDRGRERRAATPRPGRW